MRTPEFCFSHCCSQLISRHFLFSPWFGLVHGMVSHKEKLSRCCEQAVCRVVRGFHVSCKNDRPSKKCKGSEIKGYGRSKGSFAADELCDEQLHRVCHRLHGNIVSWKNSMPKTTHRVPVVLTDSNDTDNLTSHDEDTTSSIDNNLAEPTNCGKEQHPPLI